MRRPFTPPTLPSLLEVTSEHAQPYAELGVRSQTLAAHDVLPSHSHSIVYHTLPLFPVSLCPNKLSCSASHQGRFGGSQTKRGQQAVPMSLTSMCFTLRTTWRPTGSKALLEEGLPTPAPSLDLSNTYPRGCSTQEPQTWTGVRTKVPPP